MSTCWPMFQILKECQRIETAVNHENWKLSGESDEPVRVLSAPSKFCLNVISLSFTNILLAIVNLATMIVCPKSEE